MEDNIYEDIADGLIIISGIILLIAAIILFVLYRRYKKRNHLLASLGMIAASVQISVDELDFFFPHNWDSAIPNLIAGIFSTIIILIIVVILLFPENIPIKFDDYLESVAEEE